jgi:hypothetical protein
MLTLVVVAHTLCDLQRLPAPAAISVKARIPDSPGIKLTCAGRWIDFLEEIEDHGSRFLYERSVHA